MINSPTLFQKSKLAIGVAALFAATTFSAHAAEFEFGDVTVNIDSTFTIGTSIRVENRNMNLIAKANQPGLDWSGYTALGNVIYQNQDVWAQQVGGYSSNGDLGNLMNDPGDAFSTQFSGSHEIDIQKDNIGFFGRVFYFKEFTADSNNTWERPIGGGNIDLCATKKAEEELCQDFRLLDAFVYGDFDLGEMPLTIRVGNQVVSWGESTFIQHGINTTNPVDVTRARSPGAELKEVFIPVGMVYASLGLTENVSIAGYYQYDWERSRLPVAGSYFATNDFAGEGGQASTIQLGFSGNPDIHLDFLLSELNAIGSQANGLLTAGGGNPAALAPLAQAMLAYPTKVAIRAEGDKAHTDADDGGQYGIKVAWFAEDLNETEFGFYHMNYHSTRPLVSGVTSDFTQGGVIGDLAYLAQNSVTKDNVMDLNTFTKAEFVYPEDIKLYGVSFNTTVGETAVAGEVSYRQDEPLQLDDVELLYMAMPEQLANAGLRDDLAGISQLNNIGLRTGSGQSADGYLLSDTFQAQVTVSHIFGPALGTDNLVLLGEVAYVDVIDFPDPEVVRLNAPGTARTADLFRYVDASGNVLANPVPLEGLHTGLSDGPESNPFASQTAWGYRLLAVADYNNIYAGINLRARATFAHDVDGTTPDPLFLFTEDRKSASIAFTFDYLSKFSATASYNAFWGGIGTTNALSDRDFVSFNAKYSF